MSYWCEVKCRTFSSTKYDTFILSANKLRKGSSFAVATGGALLLPYMP